MIRTLIQDYEYIHIVVGIIGNLLFVVGSVLFFHVFEEYYTLAVAMFVAGSLFMFIGALGSGLHRLWQHREQKYRSTS